MISGYFPYVSDLKKFLDFSPEVPREFVPDPMPCSCSKEKLMKLNGEACEHGTLWGLGALRNLLAGRNSIPDQPKVDTEARREVLKQQVGRTK